MHQLALDDHALRPRVVTRRLLPRSLADLLALQAVFSLEHHVAPANAILGLAGRANALIEDLHPPFLVLGGVGVKVNDLAVRESDAEALLNEHVALLLFGEARLAAATSSTCGFFLCQCPAVIDKL